MYANVHCYNWPVIGIFIHCKEKLPKAICCCLQTLNFVLLVIYSMYVTALKLGLTGYAPCVSIPTQSKVSCMSVCIYLSVIKVKRILI